MGEDRGGILLKSLGLDRSFEVVEKRRAPGLAGSKCRGRGGCEDHKGDSEVVACRILFRGFRACRL